MSMPEEIEYRCSCGATNSATMWRSINLTLDPTFADKIIDNSLFESECRECHRVNTLVYPVLFHDMQRFYMVWFIPQQSSDEYEEAMGQMLLPDMRQTYQLRLIHDLNTFKEWVHIWRDGLDDRNMLLLKPKVVESIEETHQIRVSKCYYETSGSEDGEPVLFYVLFIEGHEGTARTSIPRELLDSVTHAFAGIIDHLFPFGQAIEWSDESAYQMLGQFGIHHSRT
jgi:hypothetical protein